MNSHRNSDRPHAEAKSQIDLLKSVNVGINVSNSQNAPNRESYCKLNP